MSTTVVGHRPAPHRHFRNLVQVGYAPARAVVPQVETPPHRDEALLAILMNPGIVGVTCTKPFLLPPRNPSDTTNSNIVEKSLGYGAFGVVWYVNPLSV